MNLVILGVVVYNPPLKTVTKRVRFRPLLRVGFRPTNMEALGTESWVEMKEMKEPFDPSKHSVRMLCCEVPVRDVSGVLNSLKTSCPMPPSLKYMKRVRKHREKEAVVEVLVRVEDGERKELGGIPSTYVVNVPSQKPCSREEYDVARAIWPMSYHQSQVDEDMKVLTPAFFSVAAGYIKRIISKVSDEYSGGRCVNAVLFVDPSVDQIVAEAGVEKRNGGPGKTLLETPVLECIRQVANRDVRVKDDSHYLCTGYDAYVYHEPNAFEAMAMLHSRVGRVFYYRKDPVMGVLGSQLLLHTLKGINHRYRVFHYLGEEQ